MTHVKGKFNLVLSMKSLATFPKWTVTVCQGSTLANDAILSPFFFFFFFFFYTRNTEKLF